MKKLLSAFMLCLALLTLPKINASAAEDTIVSRYDMVAWGSAKYAKQVSILFNSSWAADDSSFYKATHRISAAAIGDEQYIEIALPDLKASGNKYAVGVFWCTADLFQDSFLADGSYSMSDYEIKYYSDASSATSANRFTYYTGKQTIRIEKESWQDYGYYYVSIDHYAAGDYGDIEVSIAGTPTVEPEPTPSETPEEPAGSPAVDIGAVGSESAKIGTFGSDDGTENWIYKAYKTLSDVLTPVVSDTSVPDDYLDSVSLPDGNIFRISDAENSGTTALSSYSDYGTAVMSDNEATYPTIGGSVGEKKLILDKWEVYEGETNYCDGSFDVSPVSVEISETSNVSGLGYRDGNSYALFYRVHIPVRFVYYGHTGTALSSPIFSIDMNIKYADALHSDNYAAYQFGEPTVYLGNDNVMYDKYVSLIPSTSGTSGVNDILSGKVAIAIYDIPVRGILSEYSYDIVIEYPLYVTDLDSVMVAANASQYETVVNIESITYDYDVDFTHVSDSTMEEVIQGIAEEQETQNAIENERYNEEQNAIDAAVDSVDSGLAEITDVLSTWEILTMPIKLMSDFLSSITETNSATITFPSFSLMGHTLWNSYTFDLNAIATQFPVLYNSLHIITGILVCIAFVRYLWSRWKLTMGE